MRPVTLCGSREYLYPHHGGNWKFHEGRGVQRSGEIPEGTGGEQLNYFPDGQLHFV